MTSEVNISVKPFACTNEGCDMSFTNEDHLMVHKKKHDMNLNLGLGSKSNVFNADQTPTPTRFLRNCEEVGLFQDLQNVNPFEETFRRATEQVKSGNIPIPDIQMNTDDTLHTPHVFPTIVSENFILKNDPVIAKLAEGDYEIKTSLVLKSDQKKIVDESLADKNKIIDEVSDQESKKLGEKSLLQEDSSSMLNNLLNSTRHLISDHNYNMVAKQSEESGKITYNEKLDTETDDCKDKKTLKLISQTNVQQRLIFNSSNSLLKSTCIIKAQERELISSSNEIIKINNVKPCKQSDTKEKIKAVLLKNKAKSSNKQTINVTSNASIVRNIAPQPVTLTSVIPNSLILSGNCIGTPFINSGQLQTISIVPALKIPIEEKATNKLVLPKNLQPFQNESKAIKNNYSAKKKIIKRYNPKVSDNDNADFKKSDNLKTEEKLKKEMSLERNRAAAHRARTKRKLWIDTLVKNNTVLTKANKELTTEVQKLKSEVAQLKSLLLRHKSCDVTRSLTSDDLQISGNTQMMQINLATMKSDICHMEKTSLFNNKQMAVKREFENEELNVTKSNPKMNIIQSKKIKPNIQPLCIPLITVTNFSNEVK